MTFSRPLIVVPAMGFIVLLTSGLISPVKGPMQIPAAGRRSAPEFAVADIDGRVFHLSDYKGKVVLLNFWATECAPCVAERPLLMELQAEYRSKGFEIIGLATDADGPDKLAALQKLHPTNYRIAYGTEALAEAFGGVKAIPMNFFLDRDGRIGARSAGYSEGIPFLRKHPFRTVIEDLLQ